MNFTKLALLVIGLTVISLIINVNGTKRVPGREIQNADEDANIGPHVKNHHEKQHCSKNKDTELCDHHETIVTINKEEQRSKRHTIKDAEPIDDDETIVTIEDDENEPVEKVRKPKSIDDDMADNDIIEHLRELARLARSAPTRSDSDHDMNRHRHHHQEMHRTLDSMFSDEIVPKGGTEAKIDQKNDRRMPKIVGGKKDINKEIKYQVVLHNGIKALCGASILSDRYLLSAAHCFMDKYDNPTRDQMYAIHGSIQLNKDRKGIPKVQTVYIPTMYVSIRNMNEVGDIAVLKLTKGIGLGKNPDITKLDLPKPLHGNVYDTYEGKQAVIAGFGVNRLGFSPSDKYWYEYKVSAVGFPTELQRATIDVLRNSECEMTWYPIVMTPTRLCGRMIGRDHRGVCKGDSGNALVYENTAIGVTSIGQDQCNEEYMHNGKPTIYTRVSYFMDLIKNAMADKITSEMRVFNIINMEEK